MIHDFPHKLAELDTQRSVPEAPGTVNQINAVTLKGEWRFRLFDLVFVLFAAPIVLLTVMLIAVIVKLDAPSAPVFYYQIRYGKGGKPFRMVKIRTMIPDADKMKETLLSASEDKGAGFKLDHDPRITKPGRFLRKSYLDELPQFWSVIKGDMAIVGPRANSMHPDSLQPWQRRRLSVRPGITGSWQSMRNKPRNFDDRCRIDLDYIDSKSLGGDIAILLRTVHVMVIKPTGQ